MATIFRHGGANAGGRLLYSYTRASFEVSKIFKSSEFGLFLFHSFYRASGHVDRFADFMVKDTKTGECFRLDHLIKNHLEKLVSDGAATPELKKECQDTITRVSSRLSYIIILCVTQTNKILYVA